MATLLDRAREEKGRSVEMLVNKALRSALSAFAPGGRKQDSEPPTTVASEEATPRPATFRTLVELVSRHHGIDEAFADDLEQIRRDQPPLDEDPWAS